MITMQNYEEWIMLAADGELDEEGRASLNLFLQAHPELAGAAAAWSNLRLQPDMQIAYEDKAALLRREPKRILVGWGKISIAAAAAMLIGMVIIPRFIHSGHEIHSIAHRFSTPAIRTSQVPKTQEVSTTFAHTSPARRHKARTGIAKADPVASHQPVSIPALIPAPSAGMPSAAIRVLPAPPGLAVTQFIAGQEMTESKASRFPEVHFAAANQPVIEALRRGLDERIARASATVKAVKATALYVKLGNKPIRIAF